MGMTFNVSGINGNAVTRLKAWGIYNVVYKGIEIMKGTNKEGKEWAAMKIKFSGDDGIFEPMVFCPGEDGGERKSGETNGRKWELPSAMEQLAATCNHVVYKLAPNMAEKYVKAVNGLEIPAEFGKLVEVLKKVLAGALNKQTQIKLVGDSRGYATLPSFVNINKEGEVRVTNNWLGENLAFTDYEVKKMNAQKNAKPTEMTDTVAGIEEPSTDNDDLDFEV